MNRLTVDWHAAELCLIHEELVKSGPSPNHGTGVATGCEVCSESHSLEDEFVAPRRHLGRDEMHALESERPHHRLHLRR
jgi:hypothetical protein